MYHGSVFLELLIQNTRALRMVTEVWQIQARERDPDRFGGSAADQDSKRGNSDRA